MSFAGILYKQEINKLSKFYNYKVYSGGIDTILSGKTSKGIKDESNTMQNIVWNGKSLKVERQTT